MNECEPCSGALEPTLADLTQYRRDLHQIPEVDFDLPKTIAYVHSIIDKLPCEVFEPCASHGMRVVRSRKRARNRHSHRYGRAVRDRKIGRTVLFHA